MSFLTALTGTPARNFQTDEMLWSCRQAKRWMMPSHRGIFTSLIVLPAQLSPCNTGASTTAGVSESCENSWATSSMHGIHMPKPVSAWQTLLYEDNRTGYPKKKKKSNLIFTRHLSYTHAQPTKVPLRHHIFITNSISSACCKTAWPKLTLPSCSQLFLWGKENKTTTSKLNQSAAQACSLHFRRRFENPLQNSVSGAHLKQSHPKPSPVPSLLGEVTSFHKPAEWR